MNVLTMTDSQVIKILDDVNQILIKEKRLVKVNDEVVIIVGDTHGDHEVSKKICSDHKETKIFLGDYVGRSPVKYGDVENLIYLYQEKIKNPNTLILLRGNHETENVIKMDGFEQAVLSLWNKQVLSKIIETFSNLPIAAHNDKFLAVHASIPRLITNIEEFNELPRESRVVNSFLFEAIWNDYHEKSQSTNSFRGLGVYNIGKNKFLDSMNLMNKKILFRGHDQTKKGFMFDKRLITVLSSRIYNQTITLNTDYLNHAFYVVYDGNVNIKKIEGRIIK